MPVGNGQRARVTTGRRAACLGRGERGQRSAGRQVRRSPRAWASSMIRTTWLAADPADDVVATSAAARASARAGFSSGDNEVEGVGRHRQLRVRRVGKLVGRDRRSPSASRPLPSRPARPCATRPGWRRRPLGEQRGLARAGTGDDRRQPVVEDRLVETAQQARPDDWRRHLRQRGSPAPEGTQIVSIAS